jgi:hypothetical protein
MEGNMTSTVRIQINFTTLKILLLAFVILNLFGCSTVGPVDYTGKPIVNIMPAFQKGEIRLACGIACSGTFGANRAKLIQLQNQELWRDIAITTSEIGFDSDLSYYFLGRAAEGLGYYDAAEIYYDLALSSLVSCNPMGNVCNGLVFPDVIHNRQNNVVQEVEKNWTAKRQAEERAARVMAAERAAREKAAAAERAAREKAVAAERAAREKAAAEKEEISRIEKDLKGIPSSEYKKNFDLYRRLASLAPDNKNYKEKYIFYKNKVDEAAAKEEISRIEKDLKGIPSSEYKKNFDLYRRLASLAPDNKNYKGKYIFYKNKVDEEVAKYEAARLEKFTKKYPYVAELTCGYAGREFYMLGCFAGGSVNTELEVWNGDYYQMYTVGSSIFNKTNILIDLKKKFRIKAQNSNETLLLTLVVKERKTGKVLYKRSAAQYGVVSVGN